MDDELSRASGSGRRTFPVELSGGQFHLRPLAICMKPSHTDRDARVEVMRA
ncbi:hypothetical protein N9166_01705 [bacterium]|nr:hypothetical protein [bacterium]